MIHRQQELVSVQVAIWFQIVAYGHWASDVADLLRVRGVGCGQGGGLFALTDCSGQMRHQGWLNRRVLLKWCLAVV